MGLETKEIENQPRLKNFNLDLILTCNVCTRKNFKQDIIAVFCMISIMLNIVAFVFLDLMYSSTTRSSQKLRGFG